MMQNLLSRFPSALTVNPGMKALLNPAALMHRLRFTKKFAALAFVVFITVLLLLYSLLGTFNNRIERTRKELHGARATLAIMQLIQAAQQHRGLSSMVIVGESRLEEMRAAKQTEVDALFKQVDTALPATNRDSVSWKKIIADWRDVQDTGLEWIGAQSFNAHTALINDLLDLQISVADDSGLVLDPDAGSHYLIETGIINLPLLLERLGRLRDKGATALIQRKTPPQTRIDFSVLDIEVNTLLRDTESAIKKVVRHAPTLDIPLGLAIKTMREVSAQVLHTVSADILYEQFKMPPADYFRLTTSAIDDGYQRLYDSIYPSLNELLEARIETAQTGRQFSIAGCLVVFAVLLYLMIADVAARKRAEDSLREFNATLEQKIIERTEALRKTLADLGATQGRMAQIIEGSPVGTFVLDHNHHVTHWNRACEVLSGVSATAVLGTREAWRHFYESERPTMADLIVSEETIGEVERLYADKWRRSDLIHGAFEAESFFPNIGETGRWIYFTAAPLRDGTGQVVGAIETLRDVTQQKEAELALLRQATRDGLTEIANRRCFDEALVSEWSRAQRDQTSLALLMIDVDHFKRYNDTYGHQKGDDCLKSVARAMDQKIFRPADLVARYGGEEFVILMPNTDLAGARMVAERIVQHVYELAIPHETSDLGGLVSISAGVAAIVPTPDACAAQLLAAADSALYAAKHAGRNRIHG